MSLILRALAYLGLPSWLLPVTLIGLALAGLSGVYLKGRSDAKEVCRIATLERIANAEAAAVARYRSALAASEAIRTKEAAAAASREKLMADRIASIDAERREQEKVAADLEADLTASIQDKGKLDALISKLRASARTDCRASSRDIDLDQRLRGE